MSVVVSSYNRASFLEGLLGSLSAQTAPDIEVVIVDNGSVDDTWATLDSLAATTDVPMLALRLHDNRGPAGGRNQGARHARGQILAITDDDCLPAPTWVEAILEVFDQDPALAVLQGRVRPDPSEWPQAGPWDHLIWVSRPTPFFETCNVAYRRAAFDAVGGFDEVDPLFRPPSGRAFGEDARLAWLVQRNGGGAAFSSEAVVHHRCVPGTFLGYARDVRHASGFPGLAQRSPLVAQWLRGGVFLSRASATFLLGLGGVAGAATTRHALPLLLLAPWIHTRWRDAMRRTHGQRVRAVGVLSQHWLGDLVICVSLIRGSIRHRRLVL